MVLKSGSPHFRVFKKQGDHAFNNFLEYLHRWGAAVASWLVRSTPDQVIRVRVLAGDIVLCSWASRHLTLTVPLTTQVYKMGTGEFNAGGNPAMD